jgi:hypothetical protein
VTYVVGYAMGKQSEEEKEEGPTVRPPVVTCDTATVGRGFLGCFDPRAISGAREGASV